MLMVNGKALGSELSSGMKREMKSNEGEELIHLTDLNVYSVVRLQLTAEFLLLRNHVDLDLWGNHDLWELGFSLAA